MAVNLEAYQKLLRELDEKGVTLVAVSKTKPAEDIRALYEAGHRDFGENYVQELATKAGELPADIRWHFIGHLQSNKVKYIAPFVHLVHGVDSEKLLREINKQAQKHNRVIDCLLQVHIAREETKFGMDETELEAALQSQEAYPNLRVCGLMGMASFTGNTEVVAKEFRHLAALFRKYEAKKRFTVLSMGMSSDYKIAVAEGSNLVRIGSILFGERQYPPLG